MDFIVVDFLAAVNWRQKGGKKAKIRGENSETSGVTLTSTVIGAKYA
jgi:hypothetical protein